MDVHQRSTTTSMGPKRGKYGPLERLVLCTMLHLLKSSQGDIWQPNIPECITEFFGDLPKESQNAWAAKLQPANHSICTVPVLRACWDVDVPKTYIVTTEDVALPQKVQEGMIESVRDDTWSVEYIASSHSPFLSRIDELVGIVQKFT